MPNFKFVISDKGKSYQVEKDQKDCPVLGKKMGENVSGDFLGLNNYELQITGGSDKDGFPMRSDIEGIARKAIVAKSGKGFHAPKGLRKRKTMRGNTIGADIVQINCKVIKAGSEPLERLLGKEEPEKEEAKKEKPEKKEAPKEAKPETPEEKAQA